jgi:hypothetical protein
MGITLTEVTHFCEEISIIEVSKNVERKSLFSKEFFKKVIREYMSMQNKSLFPFTQPIHTVSFLLIKKTEQ